MKKEIIACLMILFLVLACAPQTGTQQAMTEESVESQEAEDTSMTVQSMPEPAEEPALVETPEPEPVQPQEVVVEEAPPVLTIEQVMETLRNELRQIPLGSSRAVIAEDEQPLLITLSTDGVFGGTETQVTSEVRAEISDLARLFAGYSQVLVRVVGHTDSKGPELENFELSLQRAEAVSQILQQQGVPASQIEVQAFGERQPAVSNQTLAGREQNRRIEIFIIPLQ
jgi:outer membrane protein OmpA-like peptidoglycan-associated protein